MALPTGRQAADACSLVSRNTIRSNGWGHDKRAPLFLRNTNSHFALVSICYTPRPLAKRPRGSYFPTETEE